MQLVAYGAQDIYLTGNPQITFFKVVYRRHTNFSSETIEQTINGTSTLTTSTTRGTVTVSRNGDLLGRVYVTSATASIESGDRIVDTVEVQVGGQRLDKHTYEWMQVWNELTTSESKANGFKAMTGCAGSSGSTGVGEVQVPLLFWFCRNPGLALPLIALQYHEVKLVFEWGTIANVGVAAAVKVMCDYIYLDTDERRRFAQVSHEYLIEQLQYQSEGSASASYKLTLNHPVKELIWTDAATVGTATAKLQLNGHDRFSTQRKEFFQLRQPMDHHTAVPGQNVPYGNAKLIQPRVIAYRDTCTATGTAVTTLHNTVSATSGTKTTFNLLIGTNFIPATTSSNYPRAGDLLEVEIRDHSEIVTGDRRRNVVVQVTSVSSQTDGWNIAVEVEDDTDAVATAFIVATTADDMTSISIIGRASECRTSSMTRNVNCYSFALEPEEHQPSGTCNFSRIDSAYLNLSSSLIISNFYAVNYNVLRIMSGMGGLAYSN